MVQPVNCAEGGVCFRNASGLLPGRGPPPSTGFSTTQAAYDATQEALFSTLDALEGTLSAQRFVCGERFTEADLRLFPTIVRFDACYATLFKCCRRRVADYPALSAWMRDVHQIALPGGGLQVKVREAALGAMRGRMQRSAAQRGRNNRDPTQLPPPLTTGLRGCG